MDVLKVSPIAELGTPLELVKAFGNKEAFRQATTELEQALYQDYPQAM